MKNQHLTRRQFVVTGLVSTLAITSGFEFKNEAPAVSVVKIKNNNIGAAVEEAIELLEGIKKVTQNKNRIMLKPNLVAPVPIMTTKPELIKALARLMLKEGKQVSIGEGSAASPGFNMEGEVTFNTKKSSILDRMQQFIFYELGYTDMAKSLNIPLINLHSGEMVEVEVPNGIMFDKITVHKSLTDIDMLVSVPMMKTHVAAHIMGFHKNEMPTFICAIEAGMRPAELAEIEIRGELLENVRQNFKKPEIVNWKDISAFWGAKEI